MIWRGAYETQVRTGWSAPAVMRGRSLGDDAVEFGEAGLIAWGAGALREAEVWWRLMEEARPGAARLAVVGVAAGALEDVFARSRWGRVWTPDVGWAEWAAGLEALFSGVELGGRVVAVCGDLVMAGPATEEAWERYLGVWG